MVRDANPSIRIQGAKLRVPAGSASHPISRIRYKLFAPLRWYQGTIAHTISFPAPPSATVSRRSDPLCFAADERLIHFDFTGKLAAVVLILHGQPDAGQHKPCGLLRDTEGAVKFPR